MSAQEYFGGSPAPGNGDRPKLQPLPPHSPQPGYNNNYNGGRPPYPQQEGYGSPQQPPPYSTDGNPTDPAEAAEHEKGLMGALAGGAAGGFAGHKVNHGILGTIGGAMMGSVAEDGIKKHKEKKEAEERHRMEMEQRQRYEMEQQQRQRYEMEQRQRYDQDHHHHHHHCHSPPVQAMRGNFSASARDIRLEGLDLVAHCGRVSGELERSYLPLNAVLTNRWGDFAWSREGNFGASARNVRLVDGGRVLEAELGDGSGGWKRSFVRLDERITNQNGHLVFLD
ncbi:CNVH-domain-containing protein [Aspergillus heteromorphus CBS 117.55]|uniref:CNVH-domain-containing protein n=1 Tax=Aspergillus heteromorphus CBS 117.55 TaxID=1448321 RepID=A0A317VSW1_9EURO|nr:CNVH-domain-containing protein [Aspergillus heteromorphus CBS 117.55]PWY77005.1 CNVH-domain-containing protein [Aspergillus heteromorphus CBS 117.55]